MEKITADNIQGRVELLFKEFIDDNFLKYLNDVTLNFGLYSEVFAVMYYNLADNTGNIKTNYHTKPIVFPAIDPIVGLHRLYEHLHSFINEVFHESLKGYHNPAFIDYVYFNDYEQYLNMLQSMGKFKLCFIRNTEEQYNAFSTSSSALNYTPLNN